MIDRVNTAEIKLWGEVIGAVTWLEEDYAVFEYSKKFLESAMDVSPIMMNLEKAKATTAVFSFPSLNKDTFWGLPGLLSDSLPDKFGNSLIDAWLARNGRDMKSFSPVERLCYIGKRGMGALEFHPIIDGKFRHARDVEISELVKLAQEITQKRQGLNVELGKTDKDNADAIIDIMRVGTSAGGARPKAIIAMNEKEHVLSGQSDVPEGYEYWLLKFDGVTDLELGKPRGYGRIEYAYYLMAKAAGIQMMESRLLEENGRAHFMTKRFDRINNEKTHLQSLCGIAHYDFNHAGAYSYEQAFDIMRRLRLGKDEMVQQFRRMVFNVIARNQDDHTKNISFLMNKIGKWKLSPAYDVTYSHNPHGLWTSQHQMTLNGKRDHFVLEDLLAVARLIGISKSDKIIAEVKETVLQWETFAKQAGLKNKVIDEIASNHRLTI